MDFQNSLENQHIETRKKPNIRFFMLLVVSVSFNLYFLFFGGNNTIEIAPLAFMRGRTLENAFIILDEAQNTSSMQMKMFLTRLGKNSRMVVVGDSTQIDLPRGEKSGLNEILEIMPKTKDIGLVHFKNKDITRHSLVTKIVKAYENKKKEIKK